MAKIKIQIFSFLPCPPIETDYLYKPAFRLPAAVWRPAAYLPVSTILSAAANAAGCSK